MFLDQVQPSSANPAFSGCNANSSNAAVQNKVQNIALKFQFQEKISDRALHQIFMSL